MPSKRQIAEAAIATIEAAYDLKPSQEEWFPALIEANLPLLDHGLGAGGLMAVKAPVPGPPTIEAMHVARGPDDLILRHGASMQYLPVEQTHEQTVTGPFILSEKTAEHPEMMATWRTFFGEAKDAIGFMTVDTDGRGLHLLGPTPDLVKLTPQERSLWEMMAAHVASGVRLRHALDREAQGRQAELPFGAEALIDPASFRVAEANAEARTSGVLEQLRRTAIAVDNARVRGKQADETQKALSEWSALVRGRWSVVDWFDTDDRRYVLALPNPPRVPNPRGLTKREQQVIAFAALGDSHKMIGYRIGLSRSRVTRLLSSAMRKLGVKTQAQLVERMKAFALAEHRGNVRAADGGAPER